MAVKVQVNTVDTDAFLGDFPLGNGSSRSIARDTNGRLWVVYRSQSGAVPAARLYVAYSDNGGETWTEELASDVDYASDGSSQIIMVDSSNIPHIIWQDSASSPERILYVNRVGGSWGAVETVRTAADTYLACVAACIDSQDIFHIAYQEPYGGATHDIDYITGVSGAWGAPEEVEAGEYGPLDITVDSNDKPYIVYGVYSNGWWISMRERTGGSWSAAETISTVAHSGFVFYCPLSIAMDTSDDLHVAWAGDGYSPQVGMAQIRYRKRTSGSWGTDTQVKYPTDDGVSRQMGPPVLILDSAGNVWIVYQELAPTTGVDSDESIYYKKITSGVVGAQVLIDATILRPGNYPSVYCGLWQRHPSSCTLADNMQPAVCINDEVGAANARLWFEAPRYIIEITSGMWGLGPMAALMDV